MQNRFKDVMNTYHKRNGAYIYNQSQSEILIRILEVVFTKEIAFWLYCILVETILPLNFYTNTLYPQAFLDYTIKLVKNDDAGFFGKSGDAINMFCLKSYYSLFTNLSIAPASENQQGGCQKSEMAYYMLDILFLLGDPKESLTIMDDPLVDGRFNVGEHYPPLERINKKTLAECPETMVRLDRTSQLLISMSIAIAEIVKIYYLTNNDKSKEKREEMIRTLSGFEEIVKTQTLDKSWILNMILNIEIYYFSKKNNETLR